MTVKKLIEKLESMPPNMEVLVSTHYKMPEHITCVMKESDLEVVVISVNGK